MTTSYIIFLLGPLLPEKLHVLNIPVSKAREITIDLSGNWCLFVMILFYFVIITRGVSSGR